MVGNFKRQVMPANLFAGIDFKLRDNKPLESLLTLLSEFVVKSISMRPVAIYSKPNQTFMEHNGKHDNRGDGKVLSLKQQYMLLLENLTLAFFIYRLPS